MSRARYVHRDGTGVGGVFVVPDYPTNALKRQWKVYVGRIGGANDFVGYVYETASRGHFRVNVRDSSLRVMDDWYVGRVTLKAAALEAVVGWRRALRRRAS